MNTILRLLLKRGKKYVRHFGFYLRYNFEKFYKYRKYYIKAAIMYILIIITSISSLSMFVLGSSIMRNTIGKDTRLKFIIISFLLLCVIGFETPVLNKIKRTKGGQ